MRSVAFRTSGIALSCLLASAITAARQGGGPVNPVPQALPSTPKAIVFPPKAPRPDFGTSNLTFFQAAGAAFTPTDSSKTWGTTNDGFHDQVLRTGQVFPGTYFAAPVNLPDGAHVLYLELDACDDTGGSGSVSGSLMRSDVHGNSTFTDFLATDGTGCSYFSENLTPANIVIDNYYNHYWFVCSVTQVGAFQVGLAGMVVGYQLQVSDPPMVATFNDVPTSHPFFQFIEALAKSGITGGCGGGSYCPDTPVTRGQMAVFLAKALGLSY